MTEEDYLEEKLNGRLPVFFNLTDSASELWYPYSKIERNGFYRYLNTGNIRPFRLKEETYTEWLERKQLEK